MEQVRPLTSLSTDELIARIEQYMVVVELRDAEIRELHAANSALLAERDALKGLLAELVACEDIKQRIAIEQATMIPETDDDLIELDRLMTDLARRKPKAWEAARAALAQEQGGSDVDR